MTGRLEHAPGPAGDEEFGAELLDLDRFLRGLARLVLPLVVYDLEVHGGGEAGASGGAEEDWCK